MHLKSRQPLKLSGGWVAGEQPRNECKEPPQFSSPRNSVLIQSIGTWALQSQSASMRLHA